MTLLSEVFDETCLRRYIHVLLTTGNGTYAMFSIGGVKIDFFSDRYCFFYKNVYMEKPYGCVLTPSTIDGVVEDIISLFRGLERCSDCETFCHIVDHIDKTCSECLLNKCLKKPDDNCCICLSALSSKRCVLLKCGHYLHYSCEKKMRGSRLEKDCPLCRRKYSIYDLY